MLTIDTLYESDIADALRLSTQAGWNQVDADWARVIALGGAGCLAGRRDGRLIATATLLPYESRAAWVGMVLVDEACRGQGIGGAIMDAVLAKSEELGLRSLGLDATDAGRPVYLKRGFRDSVGVVRRRLSAPIRTHWNGGGEYLDRSRLTELAQFDREMMGIDRSPLLERLLGENVGIFVRDEQRKICGFGFRRSGRTADQLGPIVAVTPAVGVAVIESLVAVLPGRDVILDTFTGGTLDEWFELNGFASSRRLTRMITGEPRVDRLTNANVFATGGLEIG